MVGSGRVESEKIACRQYLAFFAPQKDSYLRFRGDNIHEYLALVENQALQLAVIRWRWSMETECLLSQQLVFIDGAVSTAIHTLMQYTCRLTATQGPRQYRPALPQPYRRLDLLVLLLTDTFSLFFSVHCFRTDIFGSAVQRFDIFPHCSSKWSVNDFDFFFHPGSNEVPLLALLESSMRRTWHKQCSRLFFTVASNKIISLFCFLYTFCLKKCAVKEFWKSVKIWQNYRHNRMACYLETQWRYICHTVSFRVTFSSLLGLQSGPKMHKVFLDHFIVWWRKCNSIEIDSSKAWRMNRTTTAACVVIYDAVFSIDRRAIKACTKRTSATHKLRGHSSFRGHIYHLRRLAIFDLGPVRRGRRRPMSGCLLRSLGFSRVLASPSPTPPPAAVAVDTMDGAMPAGCRECVVSWVC